MNAMDRIYRIVLDRQEKERTIFDRIYMINTIKAFQKIMLIM